MEREFDRRESFSTFVESKFQELVDLCALHQIPFSFSMVTQSEPGKFTGIDSHWNPNKDDNPVTVAQRSIEEWYEDYPNTKTTTLMGTTMSHSKK